MFVIEVKTGLILRMLLNNFFKNLIYDPVSVLGILVFYILLVNLPISLGAVFKKKSSFTVRFLTILVNLLIAFQLLFQFEDHLVDFVRCIIRQALDKHFGQNLRL